MGIFVFQNIVIFLVLVIAWAIPDMPVKLKEKIRRETYIINNIIIEQARNSNKRQDITTKTRKVPSNLPSTARHVAEVRPTKFSKARSLPKIDESFESILSTPKPRETLKKRKKKGKATSSNVEAAQSSGRDAQRISTPLISEDRPKKKRKKQVQGEDQPQVQEEPPKKKRKKAGGHNSLAGESPDVGRTLPQELPPPKRKKKPKPNKTNHDD